MNLKKIVSVGLIATLFLTGCTPFSSDTPEETPLATPSLPEVVVEKTKRTSFTPELVLSGTITAKDEITIASEVTGTVSKVLKKEGDKITEGMTVMNLESQTNLLKASYSASQISFTNSTKAFSLTQQSSVQEIKKAQIGIKNAEIALGNSKISLDAAQINYDKIKNSEKFTKNTNISQSENAEKLVEIAEKNLELAQKTYSDIVENEKQSELQLIENIANTLSGILIPLRSDMTFADTLIGASQFRKKDNDSFEIYLIGTTGNLMKNTQDLWNQASPLLEEFEIRFAEIDQISYQLEDRQELEYLLRDSLSKIKKVRGILRNIEKMLYNSIESQTLPVSQIEEWKQRVLQMQEQIEGQIQSVTEIQQQLSEFDIQSPQRISHAEINISVMESQLASSKENLSIAKNAQNSTDISLDSDLLAAKNSYKTAENAKSNAENAVSLAQSQLELVKIQGQLSVQSALAQQDSARALLAQSALSLSKLTIQSGIKGTISKVLAFDGDTVSPGTPLVIISDFSSLKLITDVSVEESFILKKGLKATVNIDGIDTSFEGKISVVYPEADKVTRRVRVEILIPNKKNIPANVFATATIKLAREKPQVYIPISALVSQNPPSIFLVEIDKKNNISYLQKKEIEIGEEKRGMVPVTKGLRPNEFIVVEKYRSLFDGDEVIMVISNENNEDSEKIIEKNNDEKPQENNKNTATPHPTIKPEWSVYATPHPVATGSTMEGERMQKEKEEAGGVVL